jgi:hypothetical protein
VVDLNVTDAMDARVLNVTDAMDAYGGGNEGVARWEGSSCRRQGGK